MTSRGPAHPLLRCALHIACTAGGFNPSLAALLSWFEVRNAYVAALMSGICCVLKAYALARRAIDTAEIPRGWG